MTTRAPRAARQKIELVFYRNAQGTEPVKDWLKVLPRAERRVIGQDLMRVQWRWPVGMPLCRAMGQGLWEVRSSLAGNRMARVLFCAHEEVLVALHGFIKKTAQTPAADLKTARKRLKEVKA
jgi:phage-related protein